MYSVLIFSTFLTILELIAVVLKLLRCGKKKPLDMEKYEIEKYLKQKSLEANLTNPNIKSSGSDFIESPGRLYNLQNGHQFVFVLSFYVGHF